MPKIKKENTSQGGWKELVQGFVVNMLEHVGENLSVKLHNWITQLKRKAVGSLLVAIGITFFLNSIAIYINMMTQDLFPWLGYGMVGLITVFIGYVMLKE